MGNSSTKLVVPISSDSFLKASLLELKQQLVYFENIVSYHSHDLLTSISRFKEQTIDFIHNVDMTQHTTQSVDDHKIETSDSSQQGYMTQKTKGPYQNIIIKVSNNHYLPKVSQAQTIFTYKTETSNSNK